MATTFFFSGVELRCNPQTALPFPVNANEGTVLVADETLPVGQVVVRPADTPADAPVTTWQVAKGQAESAPAPPEDVPANEEV